MSLTESPENGPGMARGSVIACPYSQNGLSQQAGEREAPRLQAALRRPGSDLLAERADELGIARIGREDLRIGGPQRDAERERSGIGFGPADAGGLEVQLLEVGRAAGCDQYMRDIERLHVFAGTDRGSDPLAARMERNDRRFLVHRDA